MAEQSPKSPPASPAALPPIAAGASSVDLSSHLTLETVQSLTRLLVGAATLGADEFLRRLQAWEAELAELQTGVEPPQPIGEPLTVSEDRALEMVRYAVIGWMFDTQERLKLALPLLGKVEVNTLAVMEPFVNFANNFPLLRPVVQSYETLVKRGENEVQRWIMRGQLEERRSRVLAQTAFTNLVDEIVDNLADNPAVKELVQTQSTGLVGDVMDEVRERTVSADTVVEGLVRRLLRRPARRDLPPPPPEVQASAINLPRPAAAQG